MYTHSSECFIFYARLERNSKNTRWILHVCLLESKYQYETYLTSTLNRGSTLILKNYDYFGFYLIFFSGSFCFWAKMDTYGL